MVNGDSSAGLPNASAELIWEGVMVCAGGTSGPIQLLLEIATSSSHKSQVVAEV